MAIQQSKFIKNGAITLTPEDASDESFMAFEYDFGAAYATATDLIEIGVLPGTAQVTDAYVIGTGLATTTAKVGLMSGDVGDAVSARTLGSEFGAAIDVADKETHIPLGTVLAIAPDNTKDRSIGIQLSADAAAGAGNKLQVAIRYKFS